MDVKRFYFKTVKCFLLGRRPAGESLKPPPAVFEPLFGSKRFNPLHSKNLNCPYKVLLYLLIVFGMGLDGLENSHANSKYKRIRSHSHPIAKNLGSNQYPLVSPIEFSRVFKNIENIEYPYYFKPPQITQKDWTKVLKELELSKGSNLGISLDSFFNISMAHRLRMLKLGYLGWVAVDQLSLQNQLLNLNNYPSDQFPMALIEERVIYNQFDGLAEIAMPFFMLYLVLCHDVPKVIEFDLLKTWLDPDYRELIGSNDIRGDIARHFNFDKKDLEDKVKDQFYAPYTALNAAEAKMKDLFFEMINEFLTTGEWNVVASNRLIEALPFDQKRTAYSLINQIKEFSSAPDVRSYMIKHFFAMKAIFKHIEHGIDTIEVRMTRGLEVNLPDSPLENWPSSWLLMHNRWPITAYWANFLFAAYSDIFDSDSYIANYMGDPDPQTMCREIIDRKKRRRKASFPMVR